MLNLLRRVYSLQVAMVAALAPQWLPLSTYRGYYVYATARDISMSAYMNNPYMGECSYVQMLVFTMH
jgi:hypothetical protein